MDDIINRLFSDARGRVFEAIQITVPLEKYTNLSEAIKDALDDSLADAVGDTVNIPVELPDRLGNIAFVRKS